MFLVPRSLKVRFQDELELFVVGDAIALPAFDGEVEDVVAAVFEEAFDLERGGFVHPIAGIEEHMEDRGIANGFQSIPAGRLEELADLLTREHQRLHMNIFPRSRCTPCRGVPRDHLLLAEMFEE